MEDIEKVLKEGLIFRDLKEIDPVYYKNNKWKIEAAEKMRQEKIDVKVRGLSLIVWNKIMYGVVYSDKMEQYLSDFIYPLLIKGGGDGSSKVPVEEVPVIKEKKEDSYDDD